MLVPILSGKFFGKCSVHIYKHLPSAEHQQLCLWVLFVFPWPMELQSSTQWISRILLYNCSRSLIARIFHAISVSGPLQTTADKESPNFLVDLVLSVLFAHPLVFSFSWHPFVLLPLCIWLINICCWVFLEKQYNQHVHSFHDWEVAFWVNLCFSFYG